MLALPSALKVPVALVGPGNRAIRQQYARAAASQAIRQALAATVGTSPRIHLFFAETLPAGVIVEQHNSRKEGQNDGTTPIFDPDRVAVQ